MAELKEWKPNHRQEQFIQLPDEIFEALYGGAAGGGKSEVLLLLPVVRRFHLHPHFKGLILRRTFPELEKEIILRSQEYYPNTGASYNEKHHRWTWPSGAILEFGHAEHESDIRKYDTAEYNYIGFDEVTSFTEFQYLYLAVSRCRSADAAIPAIVRAATNPGNVGHGWVRRRFVEAYREGGKVLVDRRTGNKRIFIPAKLTDNTVLMKSDPQYYNRLLLLPEAERKAKLDGDWWTFVGQVFEDFRDKNYAGEPDNALHVIPPFVIPDWWPKIIAIDWGYSAMLWAGFAALSPDRRIYIYREYAVRRKQIADWSTEIGKLADMDSVAAIYLDPSAWQNRGESKLIWEQFRDFSGYTPIPADNNRISGKVLIQDYLRWEPRPVRKVQKDGAFDKETAERILRGQGLDKYKAYLIDYEPEAPETAIPKLQIFSDCEELIRAIPLCVYEKEDSRSGKKAEDVAEFDGDDPYDGLRYLVKAAHHYLEDSKLDADKRIKINEAVQQLNSTGDWTSFYRNMENLDAKNRKSVV